MLPESSIMSPSTVPSSDTAKDAKLQDLMPSELLYATITLARPTSAIPRTCSLLHSICTRGHDIHIAWRNHVLLGDLASRPSSADDINVPNALVFDRSNIKNTLDFLLQLQLGNQDSAQATGFAPSCPSTLGPVFTTDYLRRLYTHTFLAFRPGRRRDAAAKPEMRTPADFFAALDFVLGDAPTDYSWWRPFTDALVLPVYFVRVGRLDLLEVCLQLMVESPWSMTLLGMELPGVVWKRLCPAENRMLALETVTILPTTTPYPLFLATLALLEWSLPTLGLVFDYFPTLAPAAVAQLVSADDNMLEGVMLFLMSPALIRDHADRIIDLY
ncbi:hypothetical protein BCR44DRAFT_276991, partial [Catenaria anguillulae PL171]